MIRRRRAAAMLLLVIGWTMTGTAPVRAEDPAAPATLRLDGAVEHAKTYTIDDLRKLPAAKENIVFSTGRGPVNASFTGVLLWDLLSEAEVGGGHGAARTDMLRKYVVASGRDGYRVVLSLGEVIPAFGGEQVIVAYAQNGAPIGGGGGALRLIVPGDKDGGRNVRDLERIDVREAQPGE